MNPPDRPAGVRAVPDAAAILNCWDVSQSRGASHGAVALLALFHDEDAGAIECWPVGRRDTALLAVRAVLLGTTIQAIADCPSCGTTAELTFTAADVAAPAAVETAVVDLGGRTARLRPVTTKDLRQALAAGDPRAALADGCIEGGLREADDLAVIADRLQAIDPQADIRLDLHCTGCDGRWQAPFDVAGYVWAEIGRWCRQRLTEVHRLASAYGWRERDILALSPVRRDAYLALCTS